MIFNCNFCPLTFHTEYDRQTHVKIVHQTKSFRCEHCLTGFDLLQELTHHYDTCLDPRYAYKEYFCTHCSTKCKSMQEFVQVHYNKCVHNKHVNTTHSTLTSTSSDSYKQQFEREQLSSSSIQQCSAIEKIQMFSYEHSSINIKSVEEFREVHDNKCAPIKPINITHPSLASTSSDFCKQKFEREQLSSSPIQECSATEKSQVLSYEHGSSKCESLQELREIDGNKCASTKLINLMHPSLASTLRDSYKQKFEREQLSSSPIQQCSATEKKQVFFCKYCLTKCKSLQEFLKSHGVKCTQRKLVNLTLPSSASTSSDSYKKTDI